MNFTATELIACVTTGLMGLVWWDIRTIRKDNSESQQQTSRALQEITNQLHACQLGNMEQFASKQNADKNFERLYNRTDDHENRLNKLEVRTTT